MLLEGTHFSHYRLLGLLGRGGMGEVYLAEDTRINRQVAVKVVHNEIESSQDMTIAQEVMRLFQREMVVVASLDHPNILPLIDFGEESLNHTSYAYLVMPYRPEGSLVTWLNQHEDEPLSTEDVVHIVVQAADALQHAHDHNIVHMDVKASNFLVRSRGTARQRPDILLADFGISRFNNVAAGISQSVRGTPNAMAPEQWIGKAVAATDQYALSIMTYQLLTGVFPFQGTMQQLMYQHLEAMPQSPGVHNEHLSTDIDAVILRALAKRPEERFPSIHVFADALQQVCIPSLASESNHFLTASISWPLDDKHPPVFTEQQPAQSPGDVNLISSVNGANVNNSTYVTPVPVLVKSVGPKGLHIFLRVLITCCLVLLLGSISIFAWVDLRPLHLIDRVDVPVRPTSQHKTSVSIPYGRLLYTTSAIGSACGTSWSDYNSPQVKCTPDNTTMTDTSTSPGLIGTILTVMPDNTNYTSNYIVEAQIQQPATSADFGISFRNQPGSQQGIYTFFLHKDGTWQDYVYDNLTGARKQVASGITTVDFHSSLLMTVVANGAYFSFYINGIPVKINGAQYESVYDNTYSAGTVGVALDVGGSVIVRRFSIYEIG